MEVKNAKTVLFLGDSITDCGRKRDELYDLGPGYPAFVAEGWRHCLPDSTARFINRGISGACTGLLLERYNEDCRQYDPDVVSVLIGINDTWRGFDCSEPTSTAKYLDNYQGLLEKIRKDFPNAVLMVMEQFLLHTDPVKKLWHWDLDPKIQATRALAAQYADIFLSLDGYLNGLALSGMKDEGLTPDGVHPTPTGHRIIATRWLKALGFDIGNYLFDDTMKRFSNII